MALSFLAVSFIVGTLLLGAGIRLIFYRDRLQHIPGPSFARLSSIWIAYQARMGRRYLAVDSAHKKYGPVVCIAPNHVSIADREAISVIYHYGGQGQRALNKTTYYDAFVSEHPSIFSTTDRATHARKRRIVSHAFSSRSLEDIHPFIQSHLRTLVKALDKLALSGASFDLLAWLNYLTFDVLSDLAFGEPIGMLIAGTDAVEVLHDDGSIRTESAIELVSGREHLSAVLGLLPPALRVLAKFFPDRFFQHSKRCSDGLTDLARHKITERLRSNTSRNDILSKLVYAFCDSSGTQELTEDNLSELVGEAVTLLSAGSDTTATSVGAIMFFIAKHPSVYAKVMHELEVELGRDTVGNPSDMVRLPYLQAIILEGLRVHSTMATGLPRYAPPGGLLVQGFHIPAMTEVSVPPYTIHHDQVWGDPERFNPERWLTGNLTEMKKALLVFGSGPRACLGKHLAYLEMQMIISTLLLRYDINILVDELVTTEGFVRKVETLPVKIRKL